MTRRYLDLNHHLRTLFGERVQKITVDAGLTCPNRDGTISAGGCIYCNSRGSGTGLYRKGLSITEQIRQSREKIAARYKARKFLIYFQSFSNTYAPLDRLAGLYEEALAAAEGIVGLSIGTRPDCVSDGALALLELYARSHLIWIEYGLQSAHDKTLRRINRGHDLKAFEQAVARTRNRNIRICAHLILGLPGESRAEMIQTAQTVARLGVDGVKIHLLYVIRNTPLEQMFRDGAYRPMAQPEYIDTVCDVLEHLPPQMVIQRVASDPHRDELISPEWALNKQEVVTQINTELERRNGWQGKRWGDLNS